MSESKSNQQLILPSHFEEGESETLGHFKLTSFPDVTVVTEVEGKGVQVSDEQIPGVDRYPFSWRVARTAVWLIRKDVHGDTWVDKYAYVPGVLAQLNKIQ